MLLLAALAEGTTEIRDLLDSDDTRVMLDALQKVGVGVTAIGANALRVEGCGGVFPVKDADLFMGNAGTAIRPLTAALALSSGHYRLSGVPRMHERPIGDLVDGLLQIGADVGLHRQSGVFRRWRFIRPRSSSWRRSACAAMSPRNSSLRC